MTDDRQSDPDFRPFAETAYPSPVGSAATVRCERDQLRAQVESLKAERDEARGFNNALWTTLYEWEARAERAEAALRDIATLSTHHYPDGSPERGQATCQGIACEALNKAERDEAEQEWAHTLRRRRIAELEAALMERNALLRECYETYFGDEEELIEPEHLRPDDYHDILGHKLRAALYKSHVAAEPPSENVEGEAV